jgi:ATP-dependent Lhr-like helicase
LKDECVPNAYELARYVANKAKETYDLFLTDELLSADYAASKLDADGAFKGISSLDYNFKGCK